MYEKAWKNGGAQRGRFSDVTEKPVGVVKMPPPPPGRRLTSYPPLCQLHSLRIASAGANFANQRLEENYDMKFTKTFTSEPRN